MNCSMNNVSNNVPLVLTDGTEGAAFFFAGNGIAVTRQGEMVGGLSQAKLDALARAEQAGEIVARRVAEFLTPHELTPVSGRSLVTCAGVGSEAHARGSAAAEESWR